MNYDNFFSEVEKFKAPSTILFRSIELKLLRQYIRSGRPWSVRFKGRSKLRHYNQAVKNFKRILDLGCGDGLTAKLVFNKKIDYGLDNDKYYIELAKKSGVYKKVLFADARDIPLKDSSVNLVFSNCVIEHIKDLDLVLNEVSRLLKKDGYFIFTAPGHNFRKFSIFSRLKLPLLPQFYGRLRDKKFSHHNCYSLTEWKRILSKYGLTVVDGYYYIDKKTAEFWDFLLFFRLCQKFIRQEIYKYYKGAKSTDSNGAAVAVFARKI